MRFPFQQLVTRCANPGQRSNLQQTSQQVKPFRLDGLETLEDRVLLSGTPVLVADIDPGTGSSKPSSLTATDDGLFFKTKNNAIWKTDGTAPGTVAVAHDLVRQRLQGTDVNGTIFFVKNSELWKIDPSAEKAERVFDEAISPASLFNFDGTLFFNANDGVNGRELWKSDGTAAGTVMVKDFTPNQTEEDAEHDTSFRHSTPRDFIVFNDELFFSANSEVYGRQLYKTDGTTAGTVLVKDLDPSVRSSSPGNFTESDGKLFFTAGHQGEQLWQTDGTRAGTKLVKDIRPGNDWNYDYGVDTGLIDVAGTLFFEVIDEIEGPDQREVWTSDGTSAGTKLVKSFHVENHATSSLLRNELKLIEFKKDVLFFHYGELWKSNGTDAGTLRLKVTGSSESQWSSIATIGKSAFFSTGSEADGFALWHTDGTVQGTTLETEIVSRRRAPNELTVFNDTLFYSGFELETGRELYKLVPGVTLSSKPTVGEGRAVRINATLTSAYNKDVTVQLRFSGSAAKGEYIRPDTKIVIPAGKLTRSIVLKVKDDSLIEGTEHIVVSIDAVTDDLRGTNLERDSRRAVVRVLDNDRARIVIRNRSSVGEHLGSQTIDVKLLLFSSNGEPARLARGVRISVKVVELGGGSATKGIDYREFGSQIVSFNPSNPSGTIRKVRFTPLDDRLVEGNETVNFRLQRLRSSISGDVVRLGNAKSILTIRDND